MLADAVECVGRSWGSPGLGGNGMTRVIFGLRVAVVCTLALGASSCGDDSNKAVCGNGVLEPGEKCDTSIPQGQNGACPHVAACDDHNPCTADTVANTTCQA